VAIFAGQKLRVSDLDGTAGGGFILLAADKTANNTTTFSDSTLTATVEANATYGFDAWVHWTSNPTPDIKLGWTTPASTTGWWAAMGPVAGTAPVAGTERHNYTDFGVLTIGSSLTMAGDDTSPSTIRLCATLRGHFTTTAAGSFTLKMAQGSAEVSDTILRAGSWLNVFRLA
jgi:hypothetical protein